MAKNFIKISIKYRSKEKKNCKQENTSDLVYEQSKKKN